MRLSVGRTSDTAFDHEGRARDTRGFWKLDWLIAVVPGKKLSALRPRVEVLSILNLGERLGEVREKLQERTTSALIHLKPFLSLRSIY